MGCIFIFFVFSRKYNITLKNQRPAIKTYFAFWKIILLWFSIIKVNSIFMKLFCENFLFVGNLQRMFSLATNKKVKKLKWSKNLQNMIAIIYEDECDVFI